MLAASSPHLSVLDQLADHLGVLWGALVAFAVVVLLTPAVGGMARRLGVVDIPGGRRVNQLPVPRLGGIGLFLGMLVPALAFLHVGHQTRGLLLGASIAVTVGIVDDFRGLPWYGKLTGQIAAAAVATGFGACVGFLRHNFYPARIIMGDSGALMLGYVLATISVQGLLKTAASVALFFPLLVLAVAIVDTIFVVVRRL